MQHALDASLKTIANDRAFLAYLIAHPGERVWRNGRDDTAFLKAALAVRIGRYEEGQR